MFANFADFLLGAGLSRRPRLPEHPVRTSSREHGAERREQMGWMMRVGTW
jgi:hypothetical protein